MNSHALSPSTSLRLDDLSETGVFAGHPGIPGIAQLKNAAPARAPVGRYKLGELDVELTPDDQVAVTSTQKLAGSALRMDRAIANMRIGGVSLADALRMASTNPARRIGSEDLMRNDSKNGLPVWIEMIA